MLLFWEMGKCQGNRTIDAVRTAHRILRNHEVYRVFHSQHAFTTPSKGRGDAGFEPWCDKLLGAT
jgi:hypothetical protein